MATAVILDLDGTVWDSHPFYAAAAAGSDPRKEEQALAGLKAAVSAAALLRSAGITATGFRGLCATDGSLTVYPRASRVVADLFEAGVPLGAVTNLPAWMARPMLASKGLERMLGSVVTFGRTRRTKPAPDPLLLCCDELQVEPDANCWYVGDAESDLRAARSAGLSFAWASWGYGGQAPDGADLILGRFSDIARL